MIDPKEPEQQSTTLTLERFVEEHKIPLAALSPSQSPTTVTSYSSPHNNLAYSIYINNEEPSQKAEEETSTVLFHSKIKKWVSDDLVENCHNCNKQFSVLVRKHHCRSCGHIYCYDCANNFAPFPENLLTLDEPNALPKLASFPSQTKYNKTQSQVHRVCLKCFQKIGLMRTVWTKIEIIEQSQLSILDIQLIKSTTTDQHWREAALYFIAKFRSLLYQFTKDKPTKSEAELLNKNAHLFGTHSCWLIPYFKSVDWSSLSLAEQTDTIKTVQQLKDANAFIPSIPCSKLFCSSRCKPNLTLEDIMELLNELDSNVAREYLIDQLPTPSLSYPLNQTIIEELTCYLPLLIKLLDRDWNDNLLNYLTKISTTSLEFRYDFLRHLRFTVQTTHPQLQQQLNTYQRHILTTDPTSLQNIINTENFIKLIDSTPNTTNTQQIRSHYAESTIFQKYEVHDHPSDPNWTNVSARPKKNYLLPTNPIYNIQSIDYDNITTKSSANNPILIPCQCIKPRSQASQKKKRYQNPPKPQTKHILFKREDLTKDQIVMNIITLMDIFLKRDENIDFNITKYKILPTSNAAGIIEIVPNAETFYNIKEKLNYTIQNFMIENNKHTTTQELRRRFATSTAAYCVITYLLGIGDRHLDNIMMAKDGSLFHIDYSFILGSDPKMLEPHMRITEDMIDALGGLESSDYKYFKDLCFRAYNCLRKHYNIFTQLLLLLPDLDQTHIKREVFKRFIPCERNITADLQLEKSLETHSRSYKYSLIDFIYRHKKEQTLQTGLLEIIKTPYRLIRAII